MKADDIADAALELLGPAGQVRAQNRMGQRVGIQTRLSLSSHKHPTCRSLFCSFLGLLALAAALQRRIALRSCHLAALYLIPSNPGGREWQSSQALYARRQDRPEPLPIFRPLRRYAVIVPLRAARAADG